MTPLGAAACLTHHSCGFTLHFLLDDVLQRPWCSRCPYRDSPASQSFAVELRRGGQRGSRAAAHRPRRALESHRCCSCAARCVARACGEELARDGAGVALLPAASGVHHRVRCGIRVRHRAHRRVGAAVVEAARPCGRQAACSLGAPTLITLAAHMFEFNRSQLRAGSSGADKEDTHEQRFGHFFIVVILCASFPSSPPPPPSASSLRARTRRAARPDAPSRWRRESSSSTSLLRRRQASCGAAGRLAGARLAAAAGRAAVSLRQF